jgi:hypothetical protein
MPSMITLSEAVKTGRLSEFIAQEGLLDSQMHNPQCK